MGIQYAHLFGLGQPCPGARYYETDDLFKGRNGNRSIAFWSRTDIFDKPDPELGYYTQLYNLDAVAYESVMLGVYSVFMGPPNFVAEKTGLPKINDLKLGFSRDGFHFSRGHYTNFLSSSRTKGTWDYGYLHPANGICTVNGDKLYFYYSCLFRCFTALRQSQIFRRCGRCCYLAP